MKYLNDFHRQATEKAMQEVQKMLSDPNRKINYEEELKRHNRMHKMEEQKTEAKNPALRGKTI